MATLTDVQNQQPINDFICEPFEIYDASTSKCEPPKTCKTTVECALLGDKLAEMILERYGDLLTDYEFGGEEDGDVYDEQALVQYELDGPLLSNPQFFDTDSAFLEYRDDIETHVYIWEMFQYLIPEQQRKMLLGFTIFTDGQDELLAQVGPGDDISKWVLEVDVVDADQTNLLMTTLLHEYAHLMTLEKGQLDMDEEVLFADEDDEIHVTAVAACGTYFVEGMGCTKGSSYLHHFYEQF